MNKKQEIELVHDIITHPAGFDMGNSGILTIRQYECPIWAVEYETGLYPNKILDVREFSNPMVAAIFFVEKRHQLQLGLDFEKELMKENEHE